MSELDKEFYNRADEHIHLSNKQAKSINYGKVSASMLFSTARFNAFVNALGFNNAEEMKAAKEETIQYFTEQYKLMLSDNLDEYINNFDEYKQT